MSVFSRLKALFRQPVSPEHASIYHPDAQQFRIRHAAYLAQKAALIAQEPKSLAEHYGDFHTFLYRPDFDEFVRKKFLSAWEPDNPHLQFLYHNHWSNKHPFNFPGPFYTGESDTCGTGICQAPDNVALDEYGCEFVFRQPLDYPQFLRVLDAAAVEVFDSYSANGNEHWTCTACKGWWSNRRELIVALSQPDVQRANNGQAQAYLDYLAGAAETDLRRYCYFLENGQYPAAKNVSLPPL
ncbi:hypothetical protein [Hymenobacter canadensis]|uniref:Uncharacterized protein n=1 Tax=Hymenobacter canadensis TaxID=2999067 RepID=A0ABY7LP74_9BACT|nr:hypothetical protein [Hymenobacter canadensis]WBA41742.1 hypothetical protein O3303_18265 [Hymenobacter canadensis]